MKKDLLNFSIKLLLLTAVLCGAHYYIFLNFFAEIVLYLPIWSVYVFNGALVLLMYFVILYKASQKVDNALSIFLGLTLVKMVLAIVFLLPLFFGKADNPKVEAFNFFIPYFVYLTFEIVSISNFLKKQ